MTANQQAVLEQFRAEQLHEALESLWFAGYQPPGQLNFALSGFGRQRSPPAAIVAEHRPGCAQAELLPARRTCI